MNYDNRKFRPAFVSSNGEVTDDIEFHYRQEGNILSCTYRGGKIKHGHLLGKVDHAGNIEMRYHQVNEEGNLMTGTCRSRPEFKPNGKIQLHETWEWTSGDFSKGTSILEEI